MKNKSIILNFKMFLQYIHVFWMTTTFIIIGILFFSLYETNRDLKKDLHDWQELFASNINKYVDELDYLNNEKISKEILKTTKTEVFKVYLDGTIKSAKNKVLVGYNIANSQVFKQINNLTIDEVNIMFYSGFSSGKNMVYFSKRYENEFIISVINPNDFFQNKHQYNRSIFTDKNNIVLYSTKKSLIGNKYNLKKFYFDGLKLNMAKQFELDSIGDFRFYVEKDITTQAFLYFLLLITLFFIFIFVTKKSNEINRFIQTLEKEYIYLANITNEMTNEIKTDSKQNFFVVADKYKEVFETINKKLSNDKLEFVEGKRFSMTIKNLNNLSIALLENLSNNAKESIELDSSLEEKVKERTEELYKVNEKLQDTINNLQKNVN